jgi:hypothetical protein
MTTGGPGPGRPPPDRILEWLALFAPPFVGGLLIQHAPLLGIAVMGGAALVALTIKAGPRQVWDKIKELFEQPKKFWRWVLEKKLWVLGGVLILILGFATRVTWDTVFPRPCPTPVELPVLTSADGLGALQEVIPDFERYEAHQGCFAVHVWAYSIGDREETRSAFARTWQPDQDQKLAGPRPSVWIPDSTYELNAVAERRTGEPAPHLPRFGKSRSIGDSPLTFTLPASFVDQHQDLIRDQEVGALYDKVHTAGNFQLTTPNPLASDTGLLFLTALDQGPLATKNRQALAAPGDFPPDGKDLLCTAPTTQGATGYLISELTLRRYLDGKECGPPAQLKPLYPTGLGDLDFPFTTVDWGDNQTPQVRRYEADLLAWLTDARRGGGELCRAGLREPGPNGAACLGTQVPQDDPAAAATATPDNGAADAALRDFQQVRPPVHVLIGIDDSAPMASSLSQVTSAVARALAPRSGPASPVGSRDSYAIWALPGLAKSTEQRLIGFLPGTLENRQKARAALDGITPHDHSANYDMLADATGALGLQPAPATAGAPQPTNAVILLTDGDGGQNEKNNAATITKALNSTPGGAAPTRLFVIAFPPGGCSGVMPDLATVRRGCISIKDPADILPALTTVLKQIATGG